MNGLRKFRALIVPGLFAGVVSAFVSGWHSTGLESQVQAEPRHAAAQDADQHFKSGGRLSEAVLQEMLVVLKRMDERLERLEKSAEQLAGNSRRSTTNSFSSETPAPASDLNIQVRRNR